MKSFQNKKILITGAASGIGFATAKEFARLGAHLFLADIDFNALEKAAQEITAQGVQVEIFQCDVSNRMQVQELASLIHNKHDSLDILINNAGIGVAGRFLNVTRATWDKTININLFGGINFCEAFLPAMIEANKGGHVVNIVSASAFVATKEMIAYTTSKFAFLGFSEALRSDLAAYKIGVTAICPGIVNTPIIQNSLIEGDEAQVEKFKRTALRFYKKRNYPPSKVARVIPKAIQKNKGLVPVSPEAWFMYYAKRYFPVLCDLLFRRSLLGEGI
jgi:NAD(P)-dependent dehydrogenase (short-subunit alcohol dehydrogenase family)